MGDGLGCEYLEAWSRASLCAAHWVNAPMRFLTKKVMKAGIKSHRAKNGKELSPRAISDGQGSTRAQTDSDGEYDEDFPIKLLREELQDEKFNMYKSTFTNVNYVFRQVALYR